MKALRPIATNFKLICRAVHGVQISLANVEPSQTSETPSGRALAMCMKIRVARPERWKPKVRKRTSPLIAQWL